MLKRIINLANNLDTAGHHKEAGIVDSLLSELASLLSEDIALDSDRESEEAIEDGSEDDAEDDSSDSDLKDESEDDESEDDDSDELQVSIGEYTTDNFEICKSAVETFEKLKKLDLDDNIKDILIASLQTTDELFGLEKRVLNDDYASDKDIEDALSMSREISHYAGILSAELNEDFDFDFSFLDAHIKKISDLLTCSS